VVSMFVNQDDYLSANSPAAGYRVSSSSLDFYHASIIQTTVGEVNKIKNVCKLLHSNVVATATNTKTFHLVFDYNFLGRFFLRSTLTFRRCDGRYYRLK